jgi:hypothetical protein
VIRKHIVPFVIIMLLGLPILLLLVQKQQDLRQRAAAPVINPQTNYFPLGIFERGGIISDTVIQDIRAHNFDAFIANNSNTSIADAKLRITDNYPDFKVYWRNADELKSAWFDNDTVPKTIDAARTALYPLVDAMNVSAHPSLKGHYVEDEPFISQRDKVWLAQQAFRERDLNRPAFSMLLGKRIKDLYKADSDAVLFIDAYPVRALNDPCELSIPVAAGVTMDFQDFLRDAVATRSASTPFWVLLQAHNFDSANNNSADLRHPAPEELREQQWIAVGEGATGIFWFKYETTAPGTPSELIGLTDSRSVAQYTEVADLARRTLPLRSTLLNTYKVADAFSMTGSPAGVRPYAASLKSRDDAKNFVVAVNRSCSQQNLSLSSSSIPGKLKDIETGALYEYNSPITFRPGDGKLFEVVSNTATTPTLTPIPTRTPTKTPSPTGPVAGGVPHIVIDPTKNVEQWWATHPFNPDTTVGNYVPIGSIQGPSNRINVPSGGDIQSVINNLPASGGTIVLSPGGTYNWFRIIGKNNIHVVVPNGQTPAIIRGGTNDQGVDTPSTISTVQAESYGTFSSCWWKTTECKNAYLNPVKNFYFNNLIFDGQGTAEMAFMIRNADDVLFDNTTFRNFTDHCSGTTGETKCFADGIITSNATGSNHWCRNCEIRGDRNAYAWLFDGVYGGGIVNSHITNGFRSGGVGVFTNEDLTQDFDGDGVIEDFEQRTNKYMVLFGNTIDQSRIVNSSGGSNNLIKNNLITSDQLAKWAILFRNRSEHSRSPNFRYMNTGHYVVGNKFAGNVAAVLYIDNTNGTAGTECRDDAETLCGVIGDYAVRDNRVAGTVTNWVQEVDTLGEIIGPKVVSNNCANCSINVTPTTTPTSGPSTPTRTPTGTPTRTPTPILTNTPTPTGITGTISPTQQPNTTVLAFQLKLHGIGTGGDNVNPDSLGNTTLTRTKRSVTVQLFNGTNTLVHTQSGFINYNTTRGYFTGSVNFGTTVVSGPYIVKVKVPQYLQRTIPGIMSITSGDLLDIPLTSLIAGDVNDDNLINILDFNLISDCYSDLAPARNCTDPTKKQQTDITDDGAVNQFDYNLFIRELSVRQGE